MPACNSWALVGHLVTPMRCEQARQLFDAYLDGELSPALATEFGAHRLRCPECRRALALLEVTGHIITADHDPVCVADGFTDRLMACMDLRRTHWSGRLRRSLYIAAPLAAAAVVLLAFLGMFDSRGGGVVAGKAESRAPLPHSDAPEIMNFRDFEEDDAGQSGATSGAEPPASGEGSDPYTRALQEWLDSGKSLKEGLNMTILQTIDILEQAKKASPPTGPLPGANALTPPDAPRQTP